MNGRNVAAVAAVGLAASVASATTTLQFDINQLGVQARNSSGGNSPFGGVTHTGSVHLSMGPTILLAILRNSGAGFADQHFSGSLTGLTGDINTVNGAVTGGSLSWTVNSGDTYSARIAADSGHIAHTSSNGGFTIDGLTFDGRFTDGSFGNVDVSDFFNRQGANGLGGSYLNFNFTLNQQGHGTADMDAFVTVPLPPAGLAGLGGLGAVAGLSAFRRRR